MRKGWFEDRRLGAEAQFYRFLLLGVWGWVVTGLYRLDVRLRESRSRESSSEEQGGRVERVDREVEDDASRLESSSEVGPKIITAGTPILVPSLRSSLHQHSYKAFQSLPVYFITSLSVVVGLHLFLPLSLEFVEGPVFSDGVSTAFSLRWSRSVSLSELTLSLFFFALQFVSTGPVSSPASEFLALALSPPLTALAISVVALCRREFKELWTYRETWGGVKPAPLSLEDGCEEKRNDDASVEALLLEKQ